MHRRRLLAASATVATSLAGCTGGGNQQPAETELRIVLYNQTENIETIDFQLRGPEELFLDTTYALGIGETRILERPILLDTSVQYSVMIDRLNGGRGVYPITPNPDRRALAVHLRSDEVVVRQEPEIPNSSD